MEQVEAEAATQGKWDALMKDEATIAPEPQPNRETELERLKESLPDLWYGAEVLLPRCAFLHNKQTPTDA